MDRYQKVEKPKPESPINENEIRITTQGAIRNYITYASSLLQEKHAREIVLKAMGQAISKTVAIAEILKKRIPRLHQDTGISSVSITDVWEPMEEGLVPVEMTRHVSMISITLSTRELNTNSPGYQAPYNTEQPKPHSNYQQQPIKPARIPYNATHMDEDVVGVGAEGEEGIGEGVVMAIKAVMEIIKVDMGITKVGMQIIKIMVGIQIVDEVVGVVEVGGIAVVMMVAGVEVQVMKVAEVEVVVTKEAEVEVVVTKEAEVEVVVTKEAEVEVVDTKEAEVVAVVMKEAEVEVVFMKEVEVEEGVMGAVGAEWVDVQGVVATRHDCK
ncbi:Ribonuclease P protein subunit p25-like protein, partial [Mucuna pruriens]